MSAPGWLARAFLTAQNAPAIARICRRLDGIPLALELAAARVNLLSVEQIEARLDDCFRVLVAGGRMAIPRHQTMKTSLDWSYNLLSGPEQALLRRLAVFSGSTLEAAETVCPDAVSGNGLAGPAVETAYAETAKGKPPNANLPVCILDLLNQLVNKSMVATSEGNPTGFDHAFSLDAGHNPSRVTTFWNPFANMPRQTRAG